MMRVFLGIELPDDVKQSLLSLSHRSLKARWQDAGQLHLTLNFLGEVGEQAVSTLREALRSPPLEPVALRLKGVGVFGPAHRPKALWTGVEPEASLQFWHQTLRHRLTAMGFDQEERAYQPHVTLARFGRRPASADDFLKAHAEYASRHFTVNELCLFVSHLSQEGARYEILERFPVGLL